MGLNLVRFILIKFVELIVVTPLLDTAFLLAIYPPRQPSAATPQEGNDLHLEKTLISSLKASSLKRGICSFISAMTFFSLQCVVQKPHTSVGISSNRKTFCNFPIPNPHPPKGQGNIKI